MWIVHCIQVDVYISKNKYLAAIEANSIQKIPEFHVEQVIRRFGARTVDSNNEKMFMG
jgi:hypothetical protein